MNDPHRMGWEGPVSVGRVPGYCDDNDRVGVRVGVMIACALSPPPPSGAQDLSRIAQCFLEAAHQVVVEATLDDLACDVRQVEA